MSIIKIDITNEKGPINPVWNMGFNTCHCELVLREDLMSHMKMAKEIGFKYIRFHNVFSEIMDVYNEDENGLPVYNFVKFDKVYDRILECGLLPFFEISFTPEALSTGEAQQWGYKLNTTIPSSYEKWSVLIKTVISHIVERYGIECVEKWYFEVWNEPDIGFFDGELKEYFELYDYTVLAVKSISDKLKVGGPATSKCAWISEFIKHIEEGSDVTDYKRVPCDFISTHAYPSDLAFVASDIGDVKLLNSNIMQELFGDVRRKIDSSSLKGIPLFMGEWNSSAGPLAPNHDEKNNAAYIVKTMNETKNIINGSLYWNLSDIYQECGFHYTPFHGGYGILNVNSIPKSSFNAFKLLNMVKGMELDVDYSEKQSGCGILSSYDKGTSTLNILLYNYSEPDSAFPTAWDVKIELQNLNTKTINFASHQICDESGSPYEWWQKLGSPEYLTQSIMNLLMDKSNMKQTQKLLFADCNTDFSFNENIKPGDVMLIQLGGILF